jgi:uncharacterized membrane protein
LIGKRISTICALGYPIAAHLAIARGSLAWIVAALALLATSMLLPGLLQGRAAAWLSLPVVVGALWALARVSIPALALYIAPVLVPAFMAWIFGRTLAAGDTPLIEQLIRLLHDDRGEEPEPAVWPYARRLTAAWTIFFIALASTNLSLAALAEPDGLLLANGLHPPLTVPQYWWSLFANVIGYALVAVFFAIEYAYRRYRFPQQPYRNMFDFLIRMGAAMPKLLRRGF